MPKNDLAVSLLLKDKKFLSQMSKALNKIEGNTSRSAKKMSLAWVNLDAKIRIAGQGLRLFNATVGRFVKSVITTGAQFERFEVELRSFTKTSKEAKEV